MCKVVPVVCCVLLENLGRRVHRLVFSLQWGYFLPRPVTEPTVHVDILHFEFFMWCLSQWPAAVICRHGEQPH